MTPAVNLDPATNPFLLPLIPLIVIPSADGSQPAEPRREENSPDAIGQIDRFTGQDQGNLQSWS
jgi:hypothetical protein